MSRPPTQLAFSLIELLVVIAVIGVLASLLLPAVARAKSRTRLTQCAGNLRQWGLAYRQYADDNQDFLPRRGQGVKPLEQIDRSEDWFNALPPYLRLKPYQQLVADQHRLDPRENSPFVCPLSVDPGSNQFLPYGMNMNLCPWGNSGETPATKFSEVVRPAEVVALGEAAGPYSALFPSRNLYTPVARHSARLNLLLLGGQVRAFTGDYVGCNRGDPGRDEVRWLTGTASDASAGKY